MKKAGKHGVVVDHDGKKIKLFWDEVESVKKAGDHGETTGKPESAKTPSKPAMATVEALLAAGWDHDSTSLASPDTVSWRGGSRTVPSPCPSEAKHPKHRRDGARFEPLAIRTRPPGCPVAAAGYRRGGGTTGRGVGSGGT